MKKIKKITQSVVMHRTVALILAMLIMALPVCASVLPAELGNWRLASKNVANLATAENQGMWISASYARSEPIANIEVQLTEGPGFGPLFVPRDVISSNSGTIGFYSSTYETLNVAGRRAVLERCSVTGQALAVALEGRTTVTFESRGVSREDLISFAESMIETLQEAE